MKSTFAVWLLPVLIVVIRPPVGGIEPPSFDAQSVPGEWSGAAFQADGPSNSRQTLEVWSPNHERAVDVLEQQWWIEDNGRKISPPGRASYLEDRAELNWAPDNLTFYITESEGYTTGFHTLAYRVEKGRIRQLYGINRVVQRDFEHRHKCYDDAARTGNYPNVVGLKWFEDSEQLLLAAEVPTLGICKQAYYFGGYLVSVKTGRILARYTPQELIKNWQPLMGPRLMSDIFYLSDRQKATIP